MLKNLNEQQIIRYSYVLILTAMLASMLLALKLWTGQHVFPKIPLFDFINPDNPILDSIILYAIELLVALNLIYFFKKNLHILLVSTMLLGVLFNIQRLQPWYFGYILLLSAYCFYRINSSQNNFFIILMLKFIVSTALFWNGLNKLNSSYFLEVAPWFSQALNSNFKPSLYCIAILIPFLELFSSWAIWHHKSKKTGAAIILFIQLYYILISSPLGYGIHYSMIPFHLLTGVMALILAKSGISYKEAFLELKKHKTMAITMSVVAIFPILNLFNLWDNFLSFSLYSSSGNQAKIYLGEKSMKFTPQVVKESETVIKNPGVIDLKQWAIEETGAAIYPEKRVYQYIKNYFIQFSSDSTDVVLYFKDKPTLFINPQGEIQ